MAHIQIIFYDKNQFEFDVDKALGPISLPSFREFQKHIFL